MENTFGILFLGLFLDDFDRWTKEIRIFTDKKEWYPALQLSSIYGSFGSNATTLMVWDLQHPRRMSKMYGCKTDGHFVLKTHRDLFNAFRDYRHGKKKAKKDFQKWLSNGKANYQKSMMKTVILKLFCQNFFYFKLLKCEDF